jgi:hypothetical protein
VVHGSRNRFPVIEGGTLDGTGLSLPATGGEVNVDTDASSIGIGEVLFQVQDGHQREVAYFSKTVEG